MSFGSPYQSPQYNAPDFQSPPRTPAVWYWYVAYCIAMALLYFGVIALGGVFYGMADAIAAEDPEMSAAEARVMGVLFVVICLPLFLLYAVAPFLPKGKFARILGIVNIAIGMTSACCLPAAIPLLIFWIKPELKAFMRVG